MPAPNLRHRPAARSAQGPAVPSFSLYGEAGTIRDLEFVHIEAIATRSQRYQWEIKSHTHLGLFQVLVLTGGGATLAIDDATLDMQPGAAIALPAATVHAFRFKPGSQGYVLTVAERLLTGADEAQQALFAPLRDGPQLIRFDDAALAGSITVLLAQLLAEFRSAALGRNQMFEWLVRSILLLLCRSLSRDTLAGSARGRAELFHRFGRLVEQHFAEHWPVSRYAAGLGMTESRLNRLCQASAGKSAFEVTQDRLLLEARRKLTYIEAPVSQLAYELGFVDPAYFCRFFKRHTGMAPSAYRRQR